MVPKFVGTHHLDKRAEQIAAQVRHYCRNQHCRSRLKEPVENPHRAFCCKGCFESFYLRRCRVCERDLRQTGKGGQQRFYCRPPHKCASEARKWPERYDWALGHGLRSHGSESVDKTGIKFGLSGHRPSFHALRHWWWGNPVDGDLSLYDEEGFRLARLVFEDGEYRLRAPITWPRLSWPDLYQARHGAESVVVNALLTRGATHRHATCALTHDVCGSPPKIPEPIRC